MPNQFTLEQSELAELTQAVDDGRAAGDPLKLLAPPNWPARRGPPPSPSSSWAR